MTYAEVIKKWTKIADFTPFYTRPRPHRCLIHRDRTCEQCHLCVEHWLWSLEQTYAYRLASIQFECRDPADAQGDVSPSLIERYRPVYSPPELPIPGDAELIYRLRPELKADQDDAMSQELAGGSGDPFTFVPAEDRTPNARLLLHGRIAPTGTHGGASPAEMGGGRGQPPTFPPGPRNKQPSESSDSESDEEFVPK